jgi:hypothetical protein
MEYSKDNDDDESMQLESHNQHPNGGNNGQRGGYGQKVRKRINPENDEMESSHGGVPFSIA